MLYELFPSFPLGVLLGAFYFGGPCFTLQVARNLRNKLPLVYVSFVARLATIFMGLYLVTADRWERRIVALLGVFLTRVLIIKQIPSTLLARRNNGDSRFVESRAAVSAT